MRNKVRQKKAQAAMEFLMTYGWAILVVLAAIAALAYFGVFHYNKLLPEHCVLSAGIACEDLSADSNSTTIVLRNGLSGYITIQQIIMGDCNETFDRDISYGSSSIFTVPCDNGNKGAAVKEDFEIIYMEKRIGFEKRLEGSLITHVQ
ncbi:hypothetical protein ACFL96_07665 [Thermoproteota archaeon]